MENYAQVDKLFRNEVDQGMHGIPFPDYVSLSRRICIIQSTNRKSLVKEIPAADPQPLETVNNLKSSRSVEGLFSLIISFGSEFGWLVVGEQLPKMNLVASQICCRLADIGIQDLPGKSRELKTILNGDQHSSHIELTHTTFFTTTLVIIIITMSDHINQPDYNQELLNLQAEFEALDFKILKIRVSRTNEKAKAQRQELISWKTWNSLPT
ncbi:hypothetical protein PROFUN_10315 [Planoprotostelium fungivorum]|uniref:Uncharacterized protein n=1 Tax=Planoprotostelium fungivorum TaxID=1890364 RepID=A0A2P6NDS5_9EUKA|nr:hypothetical protein PROFUN_10315 [Planoprotostelium fungivorum]